MDFVRLDQIRRVEQDVAEMERMVTHVGESIGGLVPHKSTSSDSRIQWHQVEEATWPGASDQRVVHACDEDYVARSEDPVPAPEATPYVSQFAAPEAQ